MKWDSFCNCFYSIDLQTCEYYDEKIKRKDAL